MKIKIKKGDPTDIILFLVIIFFLAISMVVSLFVNSKIQNIIDNTTLNQSSAYSSITTSFDVINEYTVQRGFILMFGLLIVGMLVSSFMIKVHPIFMFIYIITLAFSIFISIYLANSYELIVSNGQLSILSDKYTMMTWVMQNIAKILLGVGALSMIIIFGKLFGGGGSQDI